jgi:hypothetical protein
VKYLITRESARPARRLSTKRRGSVLEIFSQWSMPESLVIHQFLVRLGEFGGCAVVETDRPEDVHYLTTAFAVFEFTVQPVLDVMDAVAVENDAIAWRDALRG